VYQPARMVSLSLLSRLVIAFNATDTQVLQVVGPEDTKTYYNYEIP
jgi:hypothetical protein